MIVELVSKVRFVKFGLLVSSGIHKADAIRLNLDHRFMHSGVCGRFN